jgi:DNA-3-methyladenine glycosylase
VSARLARAFFERDTITVARELLGQRLVAVRQHARCGGLIVEVEAYIGESDRACHARSGPTERNRAMYGRPGCAYVYFIYGMHYCLNIVTETEGFPAAILIRALQPVEGIPAMVHRRGGRDGVEIANGPAKLCQALAIDRRHNGADMCAPDATLFVEGEALVPEGSVVRGRRIGVRGDERALAAPWRLHLRDNPYVSGHRPGSANVGGVHAAR